MKIKKQATLDVRQLIQLENALIDLDNVIQVKADTIPGYQTVAAAIYGAESTGLIQRSRQGAQAVAKQVSKTKFRMPNTKQKILIVGAVYIVHANGWDRKFVDNFKKTKQEIHVHVNNLADKVEDAQKGSGGK